MSLSQCHELLEKIAQLFNLIAGATYLHSNKNPDRILQE